jgi:N6-adenosine-specific RNA methylase IME4
MTPCAAWGFNYKTNLIWDKVDHNFGNYVSVRHEHLLIATRGSCTPDRPTPMIDSVQTERQQGIHSAKPESFRKILERLYDGPYLELFARERVDGWDAFGNDSKLWAEPDVEATA